MSNVDFGMIKKSMKAGMKFGPERSYKIFAVNLNSVANICYKTMRPVIPQRTIDKLSLVGEDVEEIR